MTEAGIFWAIEVLLLAGGLLAAVVNEKSTKNIKSKKITFRAYLLSYVFTLATLALLCMTGVFQGWLPVDAYRTFSDLYTIGLIFVFISGFVLVIHRRGFVMSYALFLVGACFSVFLFEY